MDAMFMSPNWFFKYDVLFEIFFFIISIIIAIYALKVYRTTGEKFSKYFGLGFILISISYLIQPILGYISISKLNTQICQIANLSSVSVIDTIGMFSYMFIKISGLVVLLFVSLKSDKIRTLWILLLTSIIAILFSENEINTFYLLSTLFLGFIAIHFIENYLKNKYALTLTVALAFIFLGFGSFHFLISVNHELFYVIGRALEFCAYMMILINWYMVKK